MTLFASILRRSPTLLAAPILLALAALGGPAPSAAEVPHGQGVLWRIEAAGAAPSHLFGTMHITDERVLALPAPVRAALEQARNATFEIIMTDDVRLQMGRAMVLADGRTLDAIVAPELFAGVAEAGRRYGLEPAQLRHFKPWALATIFSIPQAELARGTNGDVPLDQMLQSEAKRQGKPLHALETPQEQIALFNDMAEADQVAMLAAAVEQNGAIETIFEEMTQSYLARDTGAIYARMEAQRAEMPELMELFMRRFNEARNEIMVARLATRLADGGAFIAVGALHLPGEGGLISLLKGRGYKLTPVY